MEDREHLVEDEDHSEPEDPLSEDYDSLFDDISLEDDDTMFSDNDDGMLEVIPEVSEEELDLPEDDQPTSPEVQEEIVEDPHKLAIEQIDLALAQLSSNAERLKVLESNIDRLENDSDSSEDCNYKADQATVNELKELISRLEDELHQIRVQKLEAQINALNVSAAIVDQQLNENREQLVLKEKVLEGSSTLICTLSNALDNASNEAKSIQSLLHIFKRRCHKAEKKSLADRKRVYSATARHDASLIEQQHLQARVAELEAQIDNMRMTEQQAQEVKASKEEVHEQNVNVLDAEICDWIKPAGEVTANERQLISQLALMERGYNDMMEYVMVLEIEHAKYKKEKESQQSVAEKLTALENEKTAALEEFRKLQGELSGIEYRIDSLESTLSIPLTPYIQANIAAAAAMERSQHDFYPGEPMPTFPYSLPLVQPVPLSPHFIMPSAASSPQFAPPVNKFIIHVGSSKGDGQNDSSSDQTSDDSDSSTEETQIGAHSSTDQVGAESAIHVVRDVADASTEEAQPSAETSAKEVQDSADRSAEGAQISAENSAEQAESDAESSTEQAESDAESSTEQAESDAESSTEQAESDAESCTEQAKSDTESRTEQAKSDAENSNEQSDSAESSTEQESDSAESSTEQAAVSAESSPEQAAVTAESSTEQPPVTAESSTEQAAVSAESSTEEAAVTAESSTEQAAVSAESSPEQVAVSAESSPEQIAVSEQASVETDGSTEKPQEEPTVTEPQSQEAPTPPINPRQPTLIFHPAGFLIPNFDPFCTYRPGSHSFVYKDVRENRRCRWCWCGLIPRSTVQCQMCNILVHNTCKKVVPFTCGYPDPIWNHYISLPVSHTDILATQSYTLPNPCCWVIFHRERSVRRYVMLYGPNINIYNHVPGPYDMPLEIIPLQMCGLMPRLVIDLTDRYRMQNIDKCIAYHQMCMPNRPTGATFILEFGNHWDRECFIDALSLFIATLTPPGPFDHYQNK